MRASASGDGLCVWFRNRRSQRKRRQAASLVLRPLKRRRWGGMLDVVARTWDDVRSEYEPGHAHRGVWGSRLRWMSQDRRYLCVSFRSNRFCLCKGASHKSNNIYLVVNVSRGIWYQKCHDVECRAFRSMEFPLSPHVALLPSVLASTSLECRGEESSLEAGAKRQRCDMTP